LATDLRPVVFALAPARFPSEVAERFRAVDFFAGLMLALRVRAA
jgi:hypothetical protein